MQNMQRSTTLIGSGRAKSRQKDISYILHNGSLMKKLLVLFMVLVLMLPLSGGNPSRTFDIDSLVINFDKTDATFTVNYDLGKIPKLYILLLGSKSIEPKIKSIFSDFDYEILKMDQSTTVLRVKNVSRLEKDFYLHDSRNLGARIKTIIIYTPDTTRSKEFSSLNSTPPIFYRA